MAKLIPATLVVAFAAVLVLGCGSSESPTKAEFIKQADAICKEAEREKAAKIEAYVQETPSAFGKGLKAQAKFATGMAEEAVLPPLRIEADELKELDTPSDEDKASAVIEEFDELVGSLEDNPAGVTINRPFDKVAERAREYGFKTCILYY